MIMLVILIPMIAGVLIPLIPFKKRTQMEVFLEGIVILNSLLVWYLLLHRTESIFTLANFTGNLSISFRADLWCDAGHFHGGKSAYHVFLL